MTLERCSGRTKDGKPCAAKPRPGTDLCPWHSPDLAERRAEWSARGGRQSSTRARARKALPGAGMSPAELQAFLIVVMKSTLAGEVDKGVAVAVATLARTVAGLYPIAEFEQRLADVEQRQGRRGA